MSVYVIDGAVRLDTASAGIIATSSPNDGGAVATRDGCRHAAIGGRGERCEREGCDEPERRSAAEW